jgi:hypothetical protein
LALGGIVFCIEKSCILVTPLLRLELNVTIHMTWFARELVFFLVCFAFLLHFLHTHLSHFVSHVILAYICLIMLIIVLG